MHPFVAETSCGDSSDGADDLATVVSMLQLSDSAFPSGRFAHSYGLEAFAQSGALEAPSRLPVLLELLTDSIRLGVGPSDGVALACAHRAASSSACVDVDLVLRADHRLTAVKLARETRDASTRTGRALLRTAGALLDQDEVFEYAERVEAGRSPGNHAVVLGLFTACLGVPRARAVASELYAFAASWAAAAIRLSVTEHHTAQALLHEARPVIASSALQAASGSVADISSSTPMIDLMAMRHEQADLRLFAS